MEFEGRHAVVTGAGTGIGRAIALRLAAEGATLSLVGRREAPLAETAASVTGTGLSGAGMTPGIFPGLFPADVRDAASIQAALGAAVAASGPLDIVVANAGVGGANGPGFQSADLPDRFDDLVQTNLAGTYHTFRASIPLLRAPSGDGNGGAPHLVAISSILARIGVAGYSGYCASKAGITGLVRAMAMELSPGAIQVNAVAPGWVDTDMAQEGIDGMARGLGISRDEAHALAMKDVPLGRMGRPEEIAGLVKWLVSADARGVTGQTLDMNGGAYMI